MSATVPLELGQDGLDTPLERRELRARDIACVLEERLVLVMLDDLLGERQEVLALDVRTSE